MAGLDGEKQVEEKILKTAGDPAQIRLTADRGSIRSGEQDLAFVTVEVTDKSGLPEPNAAQEIRFALTGPGVIQAVGNADMSSDERYQGDRRHVWHGRALVVVRSTNATGTIELSATAPGLHSGHVRIPAAQN